MRSDKVTIIVIVLIMFVLVMWYAYGRQGYAGYAGYAGLSYDRDQGEYDRDQEPQATTPLPPQPRTRPQSDLTTFYGWDGAFGGTTASDLAYVWSK
jgi:hypothetical protein